MQSILRDMGTNQPIYTEIVICVLRAHGLVSSKEPYHVLLNGLAI